MVTKFLLLDTNIWIDLANEPKNFSQLSFLSAIAAFNNYQLLIPDSVKIEFRRNDTQTLESFKSKYQKNLGESYRTFKNIFLNQGSLISDLNQLKQKAETSLGGLGSSLPTNRDIIKSLLQSAEQAATSHLMSEAASRCLNHTPPASSDRSSVGDCLIWLSILEYLDKGDVYFCTANTKDFSEKNREDKLNADLQIEAQSKKFSINFFNKLNKLINSILPQSEALPTFIVSSLPQFVCPVCHSSNYVISYSPAVGGVNRMGVCSDCDTTWRVVFEPIPESILRTELSGYNTVGEEIRIVWMGFNEGWVQV